MRNDISALLTRPSLLAMASAARARTAKAGVPVDLDDITLPTRQAETAEFGGAL